uniref:WSN domain-containing protein n=1 Tax=Caenorhabditis japonica TaxID=281687 RepID=A0A8R1I5J2_CAEJA
MKKTDDSSTAKNGKLFKSSVVVLIVAIFMFLQHPGFSGQKVQSKRNYEFKNYEDVEKKTAALASVMNAIALHSELLNGTGTARKVLSEALGVQDDSLFDLINQTNIRDVVNSIAFFDASIHQPMRIIKEIPEYLDKLSLHNSINLAGPPISNMLPSLIGISEEILGIFTDIHNINITMISIVDEIKKPSWDDEVVLDSVMNLRINVGDVFIKRRRVEKKKVVESLNLFVWDFEQYQLRMDFIFLNNLNKGLDSLQHSATKIQAWLNSGDHKRIAKQLKIVNGLTSTTAKILDNEALIGFPQGSRDLKKLPKYLKSKWFKNILNDGKSLNELEGQLQPIVQFWKDVARAERLWTKSSRRHWSNAIGQSLKNFEKIDAFNSTSISSALTNMSAIIRKHIANFNIPFFDEFQQLLNSSKILTSFNIKLKAIKEPIDFLESV